MGALPPAAAGRYVLALHDFDAPTVVADEPDPLPALLAAARMEGFAAGERAGRAAALASAEAAAAVALREIAASLALGTEAVAATAEPNALAVARAAVAALCAALPSLAERCAEAEVARFTAALLPCLTPEPLLTLSVAPPLVPAIAARFAAEPRIEVHPDPALAPGDALLAWRDGSAERRAGQAQAAVMALIADLGLG
jgi:hypothetical protein